MTKSVVVSIIILYLSATMPSFAQKENPMMDLIRENFENAASQYKLLAKNTPPAVMPRNYNQKENRLVTSNTSWWTSGFFPGSLWYIYEFTGDTSIKAEAERRLKILEKEKYHSKDHDLGFMIYCSFGNAYRITSIPSYKETVLTAAETLTKRYRPQIRSMQSWDSSGNWTTPVIIDNMMNLELLYWAGNQTGNDKLRAMAVEHANTTMINHYRPDHSAYHVVDYDLTTGKVTKKKTAQGFADGSAWARGQSWGLYGFVMMYRFTKDPVYLDLSRSIAGFILNHPRLPADKIPYWDFDAPGIPDTYRDVSASAILASALLELGQYVGKKEKKKYVGVAATILKNLSGEKYRNRPGENGGFILKHSVGAIPYNSEVDVPLTYADYYFLEALLRYKKWYL